MACDFNKRALEVFGKHNRNMSIASPNIWTDEREGELLTYLDLNIVKKWAIAHLFHNDIWNPSVLDVGAGKGRMTRHFAEFASLVIALEPFSDFYEVLEKVCKPYSNVEPAKLTLSEYIARSSLKFNLIYVSGVTPYIDDNELKQFFNDANRCLAPMGLMCVREYGSPDKTVYTPNDINRTREHLTGIAHESGFECTRWRRAYPPLFFPNLHLIWPNILTNRLKILALDKRLFPLWELLAQLNLPRGRNKCFYVYLFNRFNPPLNSPQS
jgi:SAM-dependent methyltransferase